VSVPRKPKPKQFPSETYAARVRRGRVPLSLSVSRAAAERLVALAAASGETKSAVVERLIMNGKDVERGGL
jgi:hypothetical protein